MHRWLDSLLDLPLKALNPLERLEAAGSGLAPREFDTRWLWIGLLAAVLSAATAALAIVLFRKAKQLRASHHKARSFAGQAEKLGLSGEERSILAHIGQLAGLKDEETIFTADSAFETGTGEFVSSRRVQALGPEMRKKIDGMIGSLREKLGFQQEQAAARPGPVTTRQIPAGEQLTMWPAGATDFLEARVTGVSAAELTVRIDGPLPPPGVKEFLIRYPNLGSVWEFNAEVIRREGQEVSFGHTDRIRFLNRRRFPRVPTFKPAYLACLPFTTADRELKPPQFVAARLVEIAGPGLLLEAPVSTSVGQRVVVAVRLEENKTVQGFGKVRRASPVQDGAASIAVELVDLREKEVGELARATNIAAHVTGEQWALSAHAEAGKGA